MKLIQAVALLCKCSRREAEQLIDRNLVKVNGQIITQYSFAVDSEKEKIEIQGFKTQKNDLEEKYYFAFHKPKGLEVSLNGHSNSMSPIIQKIGVNNLKPVGRLDFDSEGLLLLTNDGEFLHKLTHPKFHIPKIYKVWVEGLKEQSQLNSLGRFLRVKNRNFEEQTLELELREGQNRQIRRSCAQVGLYVKRILRTGIGAVQLGELKAEHWTPLKLSLVKKLFQNEYTN